MTIDRLIEEIESYGSNGDDVRRELADAFESFATLIEIAHEGVAIGTRDYNFVKKLQAYAQRLKVIK